MGYTLFLGTKFPVHKSIELVKRDLKMLGHHGATITPGIGVWKGEMEDSLQIYISGIDYHEAQEIGSRLLLTFGEETIGVREETDLKFWNGEEEKV